jgi:hypothetical protein
MYLLEVFTLLSHSIWNILSYKKFAKLYMLYKLSYRCANIQFLNVKLKVLQTLNETLACL